MRASLPSLAMRCYTVAAAYLCIHQFLSIKDAEGCLCVIACGCCQVEVLDSLQHVPVAGMNDAGPHFICLREAGQG